jgi:hypothetical protein
MKANAKLTASIANLQKRIRNMTFIINGELRYGVWNGCPQGQAQDPYRCIEEVWPSSGGWTPYQCCRKRGHGPDGLYCKQHAKKHTTENPND